MTIDPISASDLFEWPTATAASSAIEETKEEIETIVPLDEDRPLHLVNRFQACLLGDMLVYKLSGFLNETEADLVHVEENYVVLRVGKRRFLPSWYGCEYSRPIEISLKITDESGANTRSSARLCTVETQIRPVGWVRNKEAYQSKVRALVRSLHAYFIAS